MHKLNALKFALAAGIYGAIMIALSTACTMIGIPGFKPFTDLIVQFYGPYGYSVSAIGLVVGAFLGFCEGFINVGFFAWLYNLLLGNGSAETA